MSKEIDRAALAKIVAEETGIDSQSVDAFIKQLFVEVEDKMIDQSLVRLDNLGLFRIIKSGTTKRILFLGATKKDDSAQKTTRPLIPIDDRIGRSGIDTEKNKFADTKGDNVSGGYSKNDISEKIEDKGAREKITDEPTANNTDNDRFSGPVYRHDRNRDVYKQGRQPKSKKLLVYQIIMGITAVLVLAVAFFAFFMMPHKEDTTKAGAVPQNGYRFEEVENEDIKNISRVIVVDQDISLRQLAIIYYGDDKFWPYLFKANENIISDGYMIPSQSIVKIPRITIDLVEFNTGQLNDKLNSLAEEIALRALRKQ